MVSTRCERGLYWPRRSLYSWMFFPVMYLLYYWHTLFCRFKSAPLSISSLTTPVLPSLTATISAESPSCMYIYIMYCVLTHWTWCKGTRLVSELRWTYCGPVHSTYMYIVYEYTYRHTNIHTVLKWVDRYINIPYLVILYIKTHSDQLFMKKNHIWWGQTSYIAIPGQCCIMYIIHKEKHPWILTSMVSTEFVFVLCGHSSHVAKVHVSL